MIRAGLLLLLAGLLLPRATFASYPHLEVTVLRAGPDTTWVAVQPSAGSYCGPGMSPRCPPDWETRTTVTPCPLNRTCPTGAYAENQRGTGNLVGFVPDTLALDSAGSYTFGGICNCYYMYLMNPEIGDCYFEMLVQTLFVPVVFLGPTPVRPATWGSVKIRYR